jgi:hypothetical protein
MSHKALIIGWAAAGFVIGMFGWTTHNNPVMYVGAGILFIGIIVSRRLAH